MTTKKGKDESPTGLWKICLPRMDIKKFMNNSWSIYGNWLRRAKGSCFYYKHKLSRINPNL
ncbi:MAG: hypothetical protein IJV33_08065, partial [Bacteroidaceae bacterium]|nr:hypothetical protein [Bacteroidaceae bacterium]